MSEPRYDEDLVNFGYLKRALGLSDDEAKEIYKYINKNYASKPQPPYYKGDTWIDGDIIYTCIKDRLIGTYKDEDWTTESGAKQKAESKNKIYLTQPSDYSVGDMWILQTDNDHKAGKKGEILISTAGRKVYDEDDWINMLGYGTIRSINEVANNIKDALKRLELNKDSGVLTIYYSNSIPEDPIEKDLWYVLETTGSYVKDKLYKYDGTNWEVIEDELSVVAFQEANQARLIEDGKIQSFYSTTEPLQYMSVGDIWTNTTNHKLYRYNGTIWVAVYDTNLRVELDEVSQRTVRIETDQGNIQNEVSELKTLTRNEYADTIARLGEKANNTDITEIRESVNTIQTNTEYAISISEDIKENGVSKVHTETGYTFDNDGLTIEKTNAKTKTTLNEVGLNVKDATGSSEESLLFAGYNEVTGETIVKSKNMRVEKYLNIGTHSRVEDYQNRNRCVLDRRKLIWLQ